MTKEIFYAQIKDGELIIPLSPQKRQWMTQNEGKKFVLEVSEDRPKRTISQNALLWLFLNYIENETGENADDLHEIAKRKFLAPRQVRVLDEDYKLPASSTRLTKNEFSEYLDKISAWSGVAIPDTEAFNKARDKKDYPTEEWQEPKL